MWPGFTKENSFQSGATSAPSPLVIHLIFFIFFYLIKSFDPQDNWDFDPPNSIIVMQNKKRLIGLT